MKRDFQAFKNRTAVTKEERLRQRKNCAAIVKDKAARLRGANDNFLITVRLSGSFVPLVTVLFVAKGADTMPKRRANGEGNIRKRKDGRWEGRYTAGYDPESGKRIIKNVLGKTQAEVKEKLKTAISESQRLDVSKAGNYTVASWVRTWYEVYAEPRIRPNTKAYYANYIENHIIPGIGSIPLDKLTTIQIQRFYNNLQKSGRVQRKNFPELKDKSLSPRVVRGVHTLLHNCLEQAVAEHLLLANPAQGCKLPQLEKKEMKILPQEKIGLYLAEAEKRGLLAAFYLELTTGLRRGELLALQWTDLDIENRTLAVTKQVNRINGELVVSPPKTRNSIRTLALPQQAVDLLIAEHKKHPRNPYMFPSPKTGTMYDPDAFRRTHDKILKAIGAEHIRFHDLRHTFATLSLKSGVDVKTLSGALGHYSAISDKNDFRRNEKACKMLTAKYRLHFANGKDHIKEERLRPYDRAKHEIYKALKEELPKVQNWADLKDALADRDIDMKFKVSRTTREIQGVKFEYNGFSFSGSKISREFSYLNIDNRLEENACASLFESPKQESRHKEEKVQQSVSHSDDGSGISLGLLNGNSSYDATAAEEAEFNRLMKKKKAKRKRGFHL